PGRRSGPEEGGEGRCRTVRPEGRPLREDEPRGQEPGEGDGAAGEARRLREASRSAEGEAEAQGLRHAEGLGRERLIRHSRAASPIPRSVTSTDRHDAAAIRGGSWYRDSGHSAAGSVRGVPRNSARVNSFTDRMHAITAPAAIAGETSGSVTRRNAVTGPAPSPRAARSSSGSTCESAERNRRNTTGRLARLCAAAIATAIPCNPTPRTSGSSPIPSTTAGTNIGSSTAPESAERPRK